MGITERVGPGPPWNDKRVRRKFGQSVIVGIALGAASCSGQLGLDLPTGTETASIAVTLPRSGQPSFTGTVAGRTLTGRVIGHPSYQPQLQPTFTYKGSLGEHEYVLHATITLDRSVASQKAVLPFPFSFVVTGSYGSEDVNGKASFDVGKNLASANKLKVPFHGQIGTQQVAGSATATMRAKGLAIVATFSIR